MTKFLKSPAFTCVGKSRSGWMVPADKDAWQAVRNNIELAELCKRIEAGEEELKAKLPVWTPRCCEFRRNHRADADALRPLNRLMIDVDQKGATDNILKKMVPGMERREEPQYIGRFRVLLVEESVRRGTHILITLPEGTSAAEAQTEFGEAAGVPVDQSLKDISRCIYMVPADHTRYMDEALFSVEGAEMKDVSAQPASLHIPTTDTLVREKVKVPLTYQGMPYEEIIKKYWELFNNGKEPQEGARNSMTYELAKSLAPICEYDQQVMETVVPRYGGLGETEWHQTIENALKAKQAGIGYRMRKVLDGIRSDNIMKAAGGTASEPPKMPRKLPPLLELLTSKVDEMYRAAVAESVFPALGAHLHNVKFRYVDNVLHEATFMNILIGAQSVGKGCVNKPIDAILDDIRKRDMVNRMREAEWKRNNPPNSGKPREERPKDLCIQILGNDVTDAAFSLRLMEADAAGGYFLYNKVDEVELLLKLTSSKKIDDLNGLIRNAFDIADHGQERVSYDSITGIAPLRLNFNASTTPQNGLKFFRKAVNDGTLSRLTISTIIERREDGDDDIPMYQDYDEAFHEALRPYIALLNNASGIVLCDQAVAAAKKLVKECREKSVLYGSEAFRTLSKRAVVIGYLKAMVLYICNGCQWTKTIENYMRWSVQMDLWCKMRYFGDQLENEISSEKKVAGCGPQDILALLPDEFDYRTYNEKRMSIGAKGDGKTTLRVWKNRGYLDFDDISQTYSKTKKYFSVKNK